MKNLTGEVAMLLVEDFVGDARLAQKAVRGANRTTHLNIAVDGVEAAALLKREGTHLHAHALISLCRT
jgi:hypothetical protein